MALAVWIGLVALAVMSPTIPPVSGFTRGTEEALRKNLTTGYNSDVRPDQVTKVFMMFHVTSIADVNIRNEIFALSGWWSMRWNDDRLQWTDYPNIPVVQFKESRLWTPVIVVSNSVDDLAAVGESSIPVRVDRHGTVNWNPPGLIKTSCTMDVSYFPFDRQTCSIEVTSFGFTIQEMDVLLLNDGLSFRYYSSSGEWDIESTSSERTEYTEDGFSYARVTFYITIKRKPLYYGLNMLLPVIICSALTLFVFLLPPESGEKIGYCLTVLLAFMVILTLVAQDLPTTASSTSILQVYIAVVLIFGGLSVVLSIIILHIFFLPDEKPIGECTERVTRFFRMVCCLDGCCDFQRQRVEPGGSFRTKGHATDGRSDSRLSMNDIPRNSVHERPRLIKEQSRLGSFRPQSARDGPRGSAEEEERVKLTWQLVSSTLDAVLFRVYTLFLLVSSLVFVCILVLS